MDTKSSAPTLLEPASYLDVNIHTSGVRWARCNRQTQNPLCSHLPPRFIMHHKWSAPFLPGAAPPNSQPEKMIPSTNPVLYHITNQALLFHLCSSSGFSFINTTPLLWHIIHHKPNTPGAGVAAPPPTSNILNRPKPSARFITWGAAAPHAQQSLFITLYFLPPSTSQTKRSLYYLRAGASS